MCHKNNSSTGLVKTGDLIQEILEGWTLSTWQLSVWLQGAVIHNSDRCKFYTKWASILIQQKEPLFVINLNVTNLPKKYG